MRTTVSIDDDLLRQAKQVAAQGDRRLGEVIDDALRVLLAARDLGNRTRVDLPVHGGSGLQPGVDLEDKDALQELLDRADADADDASH